MPGKLITTTCLFCGATFTYHNRPEGRLFCKNTCYFAHRQSQQPVRTCEQCGKEFRASPYAVDHDLAKYCSEACQHESNRNRTRIEFWSRVEKTDTCWLWTGFRNAQGYGKLNVAGRKRGAHQVAYELTYGPIPKGLDICHHCDNPPCVRPDHLFAGTVSDNMNDAVAKGRKGGKPNLLIAGERHGLAVLTDETVREIRRLFASGMMKKDIATRLNIGRHLVQSVVNGHTWSHVV